VHAIAFRSVVLGPGQGIVSGLRPMLWKGLGPPLLQLLRDAPLMSQMGQNPPHSGSIVSQLPPAPDMPDALGWAALCQGTKSLRDSGEVRHVLSAILRGEIVGSEGGGPS
jgi:hypothetical protein